MLQQTQVATVLAYYERFLARFPTVSALAEAELDAVLALWAGLGYYRRARLLHEAARRIQLEHGGVFPRRAAAIAQLPGIGRSTAAAIAVFAHQERAAILDGNVKRVLARHAGVSEHTPASARLRQLWQEAEARLPKRRQDLVAYTQGLMDLGSSICTARAPRCPDCPVAADCQALSKGELATQPPAATRKTRPLRRQRFLLALYGSEILLVRRPSTGIWGGLWCLPELSEQEDAKLAARRWGVESATTCEPLPVIRHAFTHFELEIAPERVLAGKLSPRAAEPGSLWLPLAELAGVGLPRPIERLLHTSSILE